jgi:hypothetical protein
VKLALVAAAAVCSALGATSGAAVAGTHAAAGARSAVSSGTWGTAQEVPGLAALNKNGGDADVASVSCASPGNCTTVGRYGSDSDPRAFAATETNGAWGRAKRIASLPRSTFQDPISVSCGSPGNCSAGGDAGPGGFLVDEVNGTWGAAHLVTLKQGPSDDVRSVSCASAGNCSAGGDYANSSLTATAYVVGEVNGVWGTAQEIPGVAALDQGGFATVLSMSCASAGNCSAGGEYDLASGARQVFVVDEVNGVWGTAQEVPGIAALNKGGIAHIVSVSCASPGDCSAGGEYRSRRHGRNFLQAFVVDEVNGVWRTAQEVPGTAALNKGNDATVSSVSCASAGNCSAGGSYGVTPATGRSDATTQAFVASEVNGVWGKAETVPGLNALNKGGGADTNSVSCASPGNCSAGGGYAGSRNSQAFVASEVNGVWGKGETVPGIKALNKGGIAGINSLSCAAPGNCSAGGQYFDTSGRFQGFVVSES